MLILVSFFIFIPTIGTALETPDLEIKIGFILPLSGDWAFLGTGVRDAALLAKEDFKNSPYKLDIIFEDNAGSLKESATAASRLINVEKVDAIVSIISGVGFLVNPLAEKAKVLNFGLCSNVDVAKGKFNFTNYITTAEGAKAFLQEMKRREPKGSKLALVSLNEEGFNQIIEQVQAQSPKTNTSIVGYETFQPQTRDFRSQLLRIGNRKPDSILLLGLSPEIETFAKQMRDLRYEIPLVSIEAFGLAERKEAFNGSWYVDAASPSDEFQNRFEKIYKKPLTAATGHAYDTIKIIVEAFEKASVKSKPSPEKVVETLHRIQEFEGVVGKLVLDKQGIIHSVPVIKEMKGGKGIVAFRHTDILPAPDTGAVNAG